MVHLVRNDLGSIQVVLMWHAVGYQVHSFKIETKIVFIVVLLKIKFTKKDFPDGFKAKI